jgi:hypothetical protein
MGYLRQFATLRIRGLSKEPPSAMSLPDVTTGTPDRVGRQVEIADGI